ncbi:MAG: ABC transporter ATP-binding protein [Sphaerochaetaceae bacterium]|nr:ABC transporter ATP-binding protein [Sphaerochaetaceae bacterium]
MKVLNLTKSFGDTPVFKNLCMDIPDCEITCVMGPSGCGKTTLLNIIAGLVSPDGGVIEKNSERISYLFQEPRLFTWKTVIDNVALVSDKAVALKYLELVGLSDVLKRYPQSLSGGQRQRVAIARAFSFPSDIILLDEPFQNLDSASKDSITDVFLNLHRSTQRTVVWVTHDISEAEKVTDHIVKLA